MLFVCILIQKIKTGFYVLQTTVFWVGLNLGLVSKSEFTFLLYVKTLHNINKITVSEKNAFLPKSRDGNKIKSLWRILNANNMPS